MALQMSVTLPSGIIVAGAYHRVGVTLDDRLARKLTVCMTTHIDREACHADLADIGAGGEPSREVRGRVNVVLDGAAYDRIEAGEIGPGGQNLIAAIYREVAATDAYADAEAC